MPEITLTHSTDTAHRLVGHEGKCARLHGHTYNWRVRVLAVELLPIGFVADFATIKAALNQWDHRTLLWDEDPVYVDDDRLAMGAGTEAGIGVVRLPLNPTAENMAVLMAGMLYDALSAENPSVHRVEIELAETASSRAYAAWDANGQRGAL